ncbi:MAG: glycoside hydrolase family 127 protein [Kiritimatiellae bacterium]|nr:glycoside hydrolase family 127 protein [Kiritimatiellia bacterium]
MTVKNISKNIAAAVAVMAAGVAAAGQDYPITPAVMTNVTVTGGFWLPRFETNRLVTVKVDFEKCELARIPNFRHAAAREWGNFKGIPFDDSDVYKVIEGAAYTLATHPDAELEKYVDDLNAVIAKAQEPDGYLYTARTLGFRNGATGPLRWSHIAHSHELYNVGHLYEAAVAYWETTGKRTLLDAAIRSADLVDRTFGLGATQLKDPPGHQEIELALCKLYRATGEKRYLDLAKHFLEARGRAGDWGNYQVFAQSGDLVDGNELTAKGSYWQNHLPVVAQREAVGHAVRATYQYCAMADVAALEGNAAYIKAIDALWENVVQKKLALNGSVGARHAGEAFGANYELPNESAYNETCAGIGNALWNQRMFLLHGDAKYIDVLERALYNGIISGVSLGGDEFFYPNPLASKGGYARSKWFGCSCCPVNVVRFIPQIVQFAYATRDDAAYVNLFVESDATLKLKGGEVKLSQKTDYPWEGAIKIEVSPDSNLSNRNFKLLVRVPGWCVGRPVPSDLYTQIVPGSLEDFKVKVNGQMVKVAPVKGYCVIDREWKKGDIVEVAMNMPARRIKAHDKVAADRGRLAVERGPVVYCAEGVDNEGRVLDKVLAPDAKFTRTTCNILGNVYPAFTAPAVSVRRGLKGGLRKEPCTLTLVPYFAWCHRGAGEMQTWFPTEAKEENVAPDYAITASYCHPNDTVAALNDGVLPKSSGDQSVPRFTFWDHLGTDEWIQYDFGEPEEVRRVEVYWFDDTGSGECRIPDSWKVEWRPAKDASWRDVGVAGRCERDRFCTVDFPKPVKAQAIRLAVKLRKDFSGGVLECRIK